MERVLGKEDRRSLSPCSYDVRRSIGYFFYDSENDSRGKSRLTLALYTTEEAEPFVTSHFPASGV